MFSLILVLAHSLPFPLILACLMKDTMGGSSSKSAVAPTYTSSDDDFKGKGIKEMRANQLQKCATEKLILDAHCHYFNYMQETEGVEKLTKAMDSNGVGYACMAGTPFKKTWVGVTPKDLETPPVHHLYDDGDLYYYSATDGNMYRHLDAYKKQKGLASIARFTMMGCGMNLGDYSCGVEAEAMLKNYPAISAFGEVTLQSDDINNVTIKGGNW